MMTLKNILLTAFFLMLFGCVHSLHAQEGSISGVVLSGEGEAEPVVGATIRIRDARLGAVSDRDGRFRIAGLAAGSYTLSVSSLGFETLDTLVLLAAGESVALVLSLEPQEHEEEEIVVTGTRTQRAIGDVPVRVEAVPQEEVEEKILMSPANVSMLLNESTGMRMQTTSPTTSSANLRIQGLPGRYTQILTDGIPNVGGLASGLGLTELPPLNLRQVEIIKGAASALYGADAISGVVNFITKDPRPEREISALVNVTSQKGLDLALYAGEMFASNDIGVTVMASRNTQPRFDVDGDGFADVPESERYTLYPKLLLAPSVDMSLELTLGFISDRRLGGAMSGEPGEEGSDAPYLESLSSERFSGAGEWSWRVAEDRELAIRAAGLVLTRDARYGTLPFDATQRFGYGEMQYSLDLGDHDLLFAGVFSIDDFDDRTPGLAIDRGYRYLTPAILAQDELHISEQWTMLASGRFDFHNVFGTFLTPRLSVMFRPSPAVTMRLGGGTGFKAPTIFIEEVEERGFRNARLSGDAGAERSQSGTFDINWRGLLTDEIGMSINAAAYLTRLDHALLADADSIAAGSLFLRNATGATTSRGGEISTKLNYEEFKLSLGYTFLDVMQSDRDRTYELALNPRHSLGAVLMWESEEAGMKVGLEAYFTGAQRLEDHPTRDLSPSYWVAGLLAEKALGPVRLFINFENFTDTRQTRFERVVAGDAATGPVRTLPVYAPLEGRVINGGVRLVW